MLVDSKKSQLLFWRVGETGETDEGEMRMRDEWCE